MSLLSAIKDFTVLDIFKSKGIKRTLAATLAGCAVIFPYFPVTAPLAQYCVEVAGWLGIAGVGQAAFASKYR